MSYDAEEAARYFQARCGQMLRVARCYVPASDLVYDVLQQVFIDFQRALAEKKLDLREDLTAPLCRMTKSRAIKAWQSARREENAVLRMVDRRMMQMGAEREDEEDGARKNELDALRLCMQRLPERQRRIVESYYLQREPVEGIAAKHGKSVPAIHQFLYRVRLKLRTCIEIFLHEH